MRNFRTFALLTVGIMLASCSNRDPYDPTPTPDLVQNYGSTRFAVTAAGQPFDVQGCKVSVHRVSTGSQSYVPSFTLAIAECPTATVTSVEHVCGKGCTASDILLTPGSRNSPAAVDAADKQAALAVNAQTTADAVALKAQAAVDEVRDARVRELRADFAKLDLELRQLELRPE